MNFMSADGKQIDFHPLRVNEELSVALHRIHMKQDVFSIVLNQTSDLLDRLQRSDFIVDIHDRNKDRILAERLFQIGKANSAAFIHIQISHAKALLLQISHRLQNGRMLNFCRDQMHARPAVRHRAADNRQIIRFRTPRRKQELLFLHLEISRQ